MRVRALVPVRAAAAAVWQTRVRSGLAGRLARGQHLLVVFTAVHWFWASGEGRGLAAGGWATSSSLELLHTVLH